jgi:branched-chain amino acid transport system ATP-binding protein
LLVESTLLVKVIFNIIRLINEGGTTVLLVEQNIYNSLLLSDEGYVLEGGKIVLQGKGRELLGEDYIKKAYLGI